LGSDGLVVLLVVLAPAGPLVAVRAPSVETAAANPAASTVKIAVFRMGRPCIP
jgi:hypothetical protein